MNHIVKSKSSLRAAILAGSIAAMLAHLAAPSASAVTYYWDNNGATAGFGTAGGTWAAPTTGNATQGWSTDATGVTLPGDITTATTDLLNFGNGATGLAAGTITVSGTVDAGDMTFASGSGAIVLSGGTINLASAETITVNNPTDTISSILAGATTSLTKAGTGTLVLSGANTYSGTTNVSAGTLRFNSAGTIGGSGRSVTVANGATVALGSGYTIDNAFLNRLVENSNAFNVNYVTTAANSTVSSALDFSSATGANLPNAVFAATPPGTGNFSTTYNGILTPGSNGYRFGNLNTNNNFGNSTVFTVASALSGASNSVVISGTSPVYLTGANPSYGGGTIVNAGAALGFSTTVVTGLAAGSIQVGAGATILRAGGNLDNAFLTRLAPTTNAFTIVANNGGSGAALDLTNFPNASLATWDNAGTQIFAFSGTITPANNTYRFGSTRASNNMNLTVANALTGARSVVLSGGNLRLAATMDFTGPITINAGTFTIGSPVVAFPTTGNGQIGGGNYAGNILNNGTVAHTSSLDQTLSGVISGSGAVTKTFTTSTGANAGTWGTTSTLTLSGANTYTGVSSVLAGTLSFSSIANVSGGSSSLGAPITTAAGTIAIGTTTTGGGIRYTGSGHTSNRVINLAGTTGGATIDASGGGALVLTSALTATGAGSKTLTLTGTNTGDNIIGGAIVNNSVTNITSLTKTGAGTWVLAGASTYGGTTTVNAGTLKLDYSTQNSSKLSDSAVLVLGGGTLDLSGGSHPEIVASTTLTAGPASRLTSSTPGSVLRMKTITPNVGATINFSAVGIATTDNPNINDILGPWATVGGTDWAVNSTNAGDGPITAYAGYTDIAAQGPASTIADGAATNVRIVADGTIGNIELGATTTTINTLLQNNANFAATINTAAKTLRTDGIWITSGKAALTVGAAVGNGSLTAATAGGNLLLINDSASQNLTINAVIADNGSTSSLSKTGTGTLVLNGANTFAGGTTLGAGTLVIGNDGALGSGPFTIAGGAVAATGTIVTFNPVVANGDFSITGTGTLTLGDMTMGANSAITNNNTTGTTTLGAIFGPSTALTFAGNGNTDVAGSIDTGTGALTKTGTGTLTLIGANTYSGATTISGGIVKLTGNRFASAGRINVTSGAVLEISNGSYSLGANSFSVGGTSGTSQVRQNSDGVNTAFISFSGGEQVLIGNDTGDGIYDLSAGTLATVAGPGGRGVILGANAGRSGFFNLSDTGTLSMTSGSVLQIGRSDAAGATGTTGIFTQTGVSSTAVVGDLRIGGASATNSANTTGTLNLSGGTFSAVTFTNLSGGNNSVSTINISGTADVTLPAFPTARGTGATATITFDGGILKPTAASATYMGGLTNTFIKAGGAKFDTTNGSITITQSLLTDAVSTGGGLTKEGGNTLNLTGTNTYTGATTVSGGTLQFSTTAALYNGTTPSWTAANLKVASAATLAFKVGGANEFTTGDVTTLLTNLGGANGTSTTGFAADSSIGFDTTNAAGGTFTIADLIGDSTGIGGGAVGMTKLGINTLTLTANNTYTGETNVNGGTLNINGTLGAGANVVNANAGVTNFGVSQTLAALNIGDGAVVTLGAAAPAFASAPEFAGGFDGGETLAATTGVASVPEPGAIGLLLAGALAFLGRRRRTTIA